MLIVVEKKIGSPKLSVGKSCYKQTQVKEAKSPNL